MSFIITGKEGVGCRNDEDKREGEGKKGNSQSVGNGGDGDFGGGFLSREIWRRPARTSIVSKSEEKGLFFVLLL